MLRFSLLVAASAAAFSLLSPAHAASEWTTACDLGNGAVNGYRYQGSKPRTACDRRGQRPVSFLIEVSGVRFGKRVQTLTEVGEVLMVRFAPFSVLLEMSGDGSCRLVLDIDGDLALVTGPRGPESTAGADNELIEAEFGEIAGQIPTVEYTAPDGKSFRTEDLKVVSDEDGCWGAGVFRFARHPRGFHDPR